MFKDARNMAEMSREEAADRLAIGNRTLTNYEHYITTTPPDIALNMQELYRDPTLTARYCSEYCPIGQVFAHSMPEQLNLVQAVMGLLKEQTDVQNIRDNLIAITADGVIDQSELAVFEGIMDELLDLEKKIEEVKLSAARMVSIPAMMQKRKIAAAAAR